MSHNSLIGSWTRDPWAAVCSRVRKHASRAAIAVMVGAGALIGLTATDTARAQGTTPAILIDGFAG